MSRRDRFASDVRRAAGIVSMGFVLALATSTEALYAADFPITSQQRGTAQKVAQDGVPLSELAPNAPDSYTIVPRDTLLPVSTRIGWCTAL